ncbi:MAG: ABC transporter permease [Candidatus Binatus sp.]|uniref:ABC transporter permease n=1 Tax=Candidatus Binatus sp. TaxID=2811406 RepID=UPI0027187C73|nr:ABC transporter permease [Candidatus Binatus sp.]MDO8431879.1 ABC transporter permease [Candidatus Binatus sp.]
MRPLIEIVNLTKTYVLGEVEVHALRGVSLTIERGEFVAIMGSSGSGKSTLMNMLGCLDQPTSGSYILEGEDVALLDESKLAAIRSKRIGFVFQNFNLLSRTSALENVELPLFYSAWTADGEHRASDLLKLVGLSGRELNHPNQLSGGQQQRVAIARALVNRPSILLADEPSGNLDSTNSAEIMDIITRLNREQGITVIVVTHDADIAAYADRVITFRDGAILSDTRKAAQPAAHAEATGVAQTTEQSPTAVRDEAWTFATMSLAAAARALRRNKMRAALTMLGIFIGVAAVIAMVAIGNGARSSVQAQIQSLGTNLIIVLPGATTASGVRAGYGSNSTLTVGDAETIKKQATAVSLVSYIDRQVAQVVAGNRNWSTSINGATASYLEVRDWPVEIGRNFSDSEEKNAAAVCLLGKTVALNLFGEGQNPIGSIVRVRNYPLRVIGVLSVKGQSNFGQDQDDVIIMPFNTAERKVLGVAAATAAPAPTAGVSGTSVFATVPATNPFGGARKITGVVNMIYAKTANADLVDAAMAQIAHTLHERHRIQPKQDDDFTIRSLSDIAQASESATKIMTMLLAAVASISLLVGGIGIMNIMLVSVTERTREIGIRMAVGARRIHIMLQFLVEAMMLSIVGGLAGIVLGIVVSSLVSMLAGWPTLLSPAAIAGGFIFSAAVGIFFGYYPARKASLLHPIEALRYE